jgi:protein-tyrosine phosphatase
VIDLHSHILPGLDDGAETIEDSLDLARALVDARVHTVAATPHVRADYPTTPSLMEEGVARLRRELAERAIPLRVVGGGEIALDYLELLSPDGLRRFGLAGNPAYLLLEFPYAGWPLGLVTSARQLVAEGITPVLAHPERNPEVQASPERLRELAAAGALVQLTAASLAGLFGGRTQKTALRLVELECAHLVSSDAHGAGERLTSLRGAARAVGDPPLTHWLTTRMPGAILLDRPLPERPRRNRPRWRVARLWAKRR